MNGLRNSLAVVIGINNYSNGITPLRTAVNDARAVRDCFDQKYGYTVKEYLNEDASLANLQHLLTRWLPDQLTNQDRLLLYFAGHGMASSDENGPAGYLLPQDAEAGNPDSFWPMHEVHKALNNLDCHHCLVILDCCFAGAFRWAANNTRDILVDRVPKPLYQRYIQHPAWQVITSAAYDQKAVDLDPTLDPEHSPFAQFLLKALDEGEADLYKDNLITAGELQVYLEGQFSQLSIGSQAPGLWHLPKHNKGQFFFTLPEFDEENLPEAPKLNLDNNPYRGLQSYEERHANVFFGRDKLIKKLYQDCVAQHPFTMVLGASGTGKSSLVKAGLVTYLKADPNKNSGFLKRDAFQNSEDQVQEQWQVLKPLRPGSDPMASLAQTIFPFSGIEHQEKAVAAITTFDAVVQRYAETLPDSLVKDWQAANLKAKLVLAFEWSESIENCLREDQDSLRAFRQLQTVAEWQIRQFQHQLEQNPRIWQQLLKSWVEQAPDNKFLIVIDQFEELVTLVREKEKRTLFLDIVSTALEIYPQQLRCVATLRLDFEKAIKNILPESLKKHWKTSKLKVPWMRQDEFRDVIQKTAKEAVLIFDPPNLVDDLINDIEQMPGALPLLSFTLSELYIRCLNRLGTTSSGTDIQNRALTSDDYKAIGKALGSLTHRANKEYEKLLKSEHKGLVETGSTAEKYSAWCSANKSAYAQTIKQVMMRMLTDEGGEIARRRVLKTELDYPDKEENDRVTQVLNHFIEKRLFVSGKSPEGEYVEPAHDILVRNWEKIDDWRKETIKVQTKPILYNRISKVIIWISSSLTQASPWAKAKNTKSDSNAPIEMEQRKFNLQLQRDLTAAAIRWGNALSATPEKAQKYLWKGDPRLPQLVKNEQLKYSWSNRLEKEFITESDKREKFESRLFRGITITIIIALSGAFATAFIQRQQAEKQTNIAQERTIQTQANASRAYFLAKQPLDGMMAAVSAWQMVEAESKQHSFVGLLAQTALIQSAYNDPVFNLKTWQIQIDGGEKYLFPGFREKNSLEGHNASVASVSFSPDGTILASASSDSTVKLWDLQGNLLNILEDHSNDVLNVSFSPDGTILASASSDSTVKLWDLQGNLIKTLEGHNASVSSVSFSPDGTTLVSASSDGTVKLWDLQGNLIKNFSLEHHANKGPGFRRITILTVAFSPDGKTLATGSDNGTIKLWDLQGNLIKNLDSNNSTRSVAFSPDNNILASGQEFTVKLWDLQGNLLKILDEHSLFVSSVDFSPDGTTLASASSDGTVKIWDSEQGALLTTLEGHNDGVSSVAFSPDGMTIATGSDNGTVKLWSRKGNLLTTLPSDRNVDGSYYINSIASSPDGTMFVSASSDNTIKLWDLQGKLLNTLEGHSDDVLSVTFSPDGTRLASASLDGTVKLWNSTEGVLTNTLEGHKDGVSSVAFSPDGTRLASASLDGTVKLWNSTEGVLTNTLEGHKDGVSSVAFSLNGLTLATGSKDSTINLWDLQGNLLTTLEDHSDDVSSVAFSPDGTTLATGSRDSTVKLWDFQRYLLKDTLKGHSLDVSSVAFSPDGTILASASYDSTVKLWDNQGNLLTTLKDYSSGKYISWGYTWVLSVTFNLNGSILGSARKDGTIVLWQLNPQQLMDWNCNWLQDYLLSNPVGQKAIEEDNVCQDYLSNENSRRLAL